MAASNGSRELSFLTTFSGASSICSTVVTRRLQARQARRRRTGNPSSWLRESMTALVAAIGRTADRVEHTLDPIVRDGKSVGMDERLVAHAGDRPVVTLALRMQMGAASLDEIEIDGDPPIRCRFEGGLQGDRALVQKAAALGANNVLAKPFTIEKMKAAIEAVFGALK